MVVRYRIDRLRNGVWAPVSMIASRTLPWWRKADELKLIGYMDTYSQPSLQLRTRYLSSLCHPLGLAPGTQIRFVFQYYSLPLEPQRAAWWKAWKPAWQTSTSTGAQCPDPAKESIADFQFPPAL
jgi:hypothetical protein